MNTVLEVAHSALDGSWGISLFAPLIVPIIRGAAFLDLVYRGDDERIKRYNALTSRYRRLGDQPSQLPR